MVLELWAQWGGLAGVGIMLAVAFAVLVYLLGSFLNNDRMRAFGRLEVVEAFYSAILLILIFWILATATGAAETLIVGAYPGEIGAAVCGSQYDAYFNDYDGAFPCHMRTARFYLDQLYAEGKVFNYELLSIHMWYSFMQNIGVSADFHAHSTGSANYSPLGSIFSLPSSIYSYMFEIGMKSMIVIRFQQFLLNFINYSLFPVLLVLGLLLRTFPFSRRLGGLLMAMAISLYFIYPMFYVLGGVIFDNIAMKSAYYSGGPTVDENGNIKRPSVITSLEFDPEEFYGKVGITDEDADLLPSGDEVPGNNQDDVNLDYLDQLYPEEMEMCRSSDLGVVDGISMIWDWAKLFLYEVDFTGLIISNESYIDSLISPGGVIDATARFVFFSMFFALLSIFSTVAAIRSLSPLLGGDIELAGLTHLL
ncbi:hypothetical protein GF415_04340 [Candidatus Micrarchaeota archaeon]|nr:hypothetical protein [Candidatus Micrarchaeota archaeon]